MGAVYNAIKSQKEAFPDKPAVVLDNGDVLTYKNLLIEVDRAALNLYQCLQDQFGYDFTSFRNKQKPPILLLARDSLVTVISVIAINKLGLTVAPMNPDTGCAALCKARDTIKAGAVLYDDYYSNNALSLQSDRCVLINLHDLSAVVCGELPVIKQSPEYPYLLTMSSGSTGDPKPVIYTDEGKARRARSTASEFGFNADDTILCASPFFHSLGQRLTFMPLVLGATMVLLPRFTVESWLNAVHQHNVTVTICVSSHLFALKDLLIQKDRRMQSIRALVSSSASIDNETKTVLFDQDEFDFYEMYGASEVATATRLSPTDPVEKRGSVGRVCQGVELKISSESLKNNEVGEPGEILVKSPLCTPGYYHRDDLDEKAFDQGWFHTGDLGYLDADGFLYFVDRNSDIIVSGGSNLYPSDIETCIRSHASVSDCIVVGVADSYLGEAAVAIVVADHPHVKNLELVLRQHVRGDLSPSQQPLLYFLVDELPLNGAGKIDRKVVRQQYNAMGLDPSSRFSHVLFAKASA